MFFNVRLGTINRRITREGTICNVGMTTQATFGVMRLFRLI